MYNIAYICVLEKYGLNTDIELLHINNKSIKLAEIKKRVPNASTEFEQETFLFLYNWLNGCPQFDIHTSGSTGIPKKISITREQMQASAELTINTLSLPLRGTSLVCLHTGFIAGKMMLVRSLINQMAITAIEPDNNPMLAFNDSAAFDFTAIVPLQLYSIMDDYASEHKLKKIKNVIVGGADINETHKIRLSSYSNSVYHTYGMTETVSHIALKRLSDKPQENFSALKGVQIKKDERGCLCVKAEVTGNEWLVTNDMVNVVNNNEFTVTGRYDNVINTGGVKVQAELLEAKIGSLFQEKGIRNRFYIKGIPDTVLGQKIVLVLEGENSVDLQAMLKNSLGKYEAPKEIHYKEKFDLTPTGKLIKN